MLRPLSANGALGLLSHPQCLERLVVSAIGSRVNDTGPLFRTKGSHVLLVVDCWWGFTLPCQTSPKQNTLTMVWPMRMVQKPKCTLHWKHGLFMNLSLATSHQMTTAMVKKNQPLQNFSRTVVCNWESKRKPDPHNFGRRNPLVEDQHLFNM